MGKNNKHQTHRAVYTWGSLLVALGLLAGGSLLLGPLIVNTVRQPEVFRQYIASKGAWGPVIFIGIQILQTLFAFIPGEVVEVGAGYAFGPWLGLIYCLVGVALASAIILWLVRKLGSTLATAVMDNQTIEKLNFLKNAKQLNFVLFLLYFIPGTPKDILTYFAGLTNVKVKPFMLICVFARIPSILTSTLAGGALGTQNYVQSAIIFGISALLAGGGYLFYYLYVKHQNRKK